MANVYEKCPAFENDKYLLRLSSIDDVKEMMTMSDSERILELLRVEGPKPVRELQEVTNYKSRSQFLTEVINPLLDAGIVIRDGNVKSPKSVVKLTK